MASSSGLDKKAGSFKTDLSVVVLCVLVALAVCFKVITHGLIYAADDIWWHVLWLKDFIGELNQGVLYPRWLAQSNYLLGSPTLVFYPPFCFYAGAVLQKVLSLTVMQATTGLFLSGTLGAGLSFYFCGRKRWGTLAAVGGAVMFMTAPFITFDIYFRASLPELVALSWLPLIMLSVDRLQLKSHKLMLLAGFFLTALTHVPSLFIYLWSWLSRVAVTSIRTNGGIKRIRDNFTWALLGLGCAAFFLLPVFCEHDKVNIAAILDRLPWQANLLYSQDFKGFFIVPDIVSKATLIAVLLCLAIVCAVISRKTPAGRLKEPLYWLGLNLFTFIMMTTASSWLWDHCKLLQFLQFPWRLMTVNIFSTAVLFAICLDELQTAKFKNYIKLLLSMLLLSLIVQNASTDYFLTKYRAGLDKPEAYMLIDRRAIRVDEFARYTMPSLLNGEGGYPGVPEYTPMLGIAGSGARSPLPRPEPGQALLTLVHGRGLVRVTRLGSYEKRFSTEATEPLIFTIRVFYFPGWRMYIDGREEKLQQAENGHILISAQPGKHSYLLQYKDTDSFAAGSAFSAICLLLSIWLYRRRP